MRSDSRAKDKSRLERYRKAAKDGGLIRLDAVLSEEATAVMRRYEALGFSRRQVIERLLIDNPPG